MPLTEPSLLSGIDYRIIGWGLEQIAHGYELIDAPGGVMDFTGKRVLVTGGTRGIGRAAVEGFLARGARVAVNGRSEQSVGRALGELDAGDRVIVAAGDVGKVRECESVIDQAVGGLGGLDVLVNNAGVGYGALIDKADEELWDATMNINLKGTFFCSKYAVPALREARGNIVNVASVLGLIAQSGSGAIYTTSKGGVINMTRALAMELAPEVRVNAFCPGYIETDMIRDQAIGTGDPEAYYANLSAWHPLGRIGRVEEMIDGILYLASDGASFTTGAILTADGGAAIGH